MSGDELRALASDLGNAGRTVAQQAPLLVRKSASDLERMATRAAPVDTGFHRSGIHSRGGGLVMQVSASAEYAQYLEWGTWKMKPQPILNQAEHTNIVEQQLADAIEQLGESVL